MSGEQLLAQVAALTARVIALEETVKNKHGIPGPRGPRGDIGLGEERTKQIVQECLIARLDEYVQRAQKIANGVRAQVDGANRELRAEYESIVRSAVTKKLRECMEDEIASLVVRLIDEYRNDIVGSKHD